MATFKVGQRVRIVWSDSVLAGREGTIWQIVHDRDWHSIRLGRVIRCAPVVCRVDVDGVGRLWEDTFWVAYLPEHLAPLTDPGAEKFLANLKKLVREPIPLTPAQLEEVK